MILVPDLEKSENRFNFTPFEQLIVDASLSCNCIILVIELSFLFGILLPYVKGNLFPTCNSPQSLSFLFFFPKGESGGYKCRLSYYSK